VLGVRVALPAAAPETSDELERGVTPVRLDGKLLESLDEELDWPRLAPALPPGP
jgi:hypothetical protein